MTFLKFLIKDLMKRKLRLALTTGGVAVGIAACVIMLGLSESIRGSFKNAYSRRNVDIVVYQKDQFDLFSSKIPASLSGEFKKMAGVKDSTGVLVDIQRQGKSFLLVFGWDKNSPHFENIEIVKGTPPAPGEREVIIGSFLARRPDMEVGQSVSIRGKPFRITGVYNSESPFEKSAMIAPLDALQALDPGKSNIVTGINVMLEEPHRTEAGIARAVQDIEKLFPEVTAQNADVFIAEKTRQIVMGEKLALLIVIIIIAAVILGLANTMITAVFERRKLMGVLVAIGWQKKDVFHAVLLESLLITAAGGLLGAALGFYAMGRLFGVMDIALFMPVWDYALVTKVLALILLSGITAALISSWIIISIDPVEVIRSE
jgi:putative ABC transport system permease protein